MRDDPARASWRQLSRTVVCGPRYPRPHSPVGLPASQVGLLGKPFAAACPEDLGLLSAVTSARASKFHLGPLPSALASWQEACYGFLMFPLQTRPGSARVWTRVRPGQALSCPPHRCQSPQSSCSGPPGSEGQGRGASDLTQKVSLDWDPSEGRTPLTRAPRSGRAQRVTRFLLRRLLWFLSPSRSGTSLSRAGPESLDQVLKATERPGPGSVSRRVGWGTPPGGKSRGRLPDHRALGHRRLQLTDARGGDCLTAGGSERTLAAELSWVDGRGVGPGGVLGAFLGHGGDGWPPALLSAWTQGLIWTPGPHVGPPGGPLPALPWLCLASSR